jgi:hypothetical protein
MTVVSAVTGAISVSLFTFFALRDLFNHNHNQYLALRLAVVITMLCSGALALFFIISNEVLPALVFLGLAVLIGSVGCRAVLELLGHTQNPQTPKQSIGNLTGLAMAAVLGLIATFTGLLYS